VGTSTDHVYDKRGVARGPIKKSRAWFFANYRYLDTQQRVPDFRAPLGNADHQAFVKATGAGLDVQHAGAGPLIFESLSIFPNTDTASFANSGDSRTWMALHRQNYGINPRWRSVISSRTFVEAVGGIGIYSLFGADPNNDGSPAYMDQSTGNRQRRRLSRHRKKTDGTSIRPGRT